MGVTAFPHPPNLPQGEIMQAKQHDRDWVRIAAGGSFLAGGLLLLSGKKKAGLAVTSGAMALTLLDQKETIKEWWQTIPKHLDNVERLLGHAQNTIEDLAAKRDKLRSMFNR
jgi:hypothetical protein